MDARTIKASLDKAVKLYLKKVGELSIIRRLTDSISLDLDVQRAREYALDILMDEMDIDHASIMLYDEDRGGLVIKAAASQEDFGKPEAARGHGGPISEACFKRGEGAAGRVFGDRRPILINDVEADGRFVEIEGQNVAIGSLLCLPLVVRDNLVGVLNLSHSEKNVFGREDRFGMMIVANQVAILLDNAENYRRVRNLNLELEEKVRERTAELLRINEKLMEEIKERRRAEEALKVAEEEKALILNTTIDLVIYHDTDLRVQWANQAAGSSVGMAPEDLIGRHCYEVWHQREEPCPGCPVILARDTGLPQKAEIASPDGREWFLRAYPVMDAGGSVGNIVEFCLDVTERKRAEEALRMTQFSVEHHVDAAFWMRPDASFIYVNKAACSTLGYSREELLSMSVHDIDPDYPKERWKDNWDAIKRRGSQTIESRHRRKDGSIFPVEITDNFMEFEGKEYNFAFARDITERKRAEAALRESEASYKLLVNSLPAVVFKGYLDWSVDFFDDKIEELTGYSKEEFDTRRMKWSDVILKEDLRELSRTFVRALGTTGSYVREYRIRDRHGNIRWLQGRGQIIRDDSGKIEYITGVFFDITDRKRMEDELSKVEKLESVGVLAGGIAHDFNNLLAAIVGNVSLAKIMVNPDDREALEALTDAEKASHRAKDLTKQLLTFAKGGAPVKEAASIKEIIRDSCSFALRGSNVRCELSLPDDLWPVEIDVGQVSQVINNLLINADQATPEGGILRVRAEAVVIEEDRQIPLKDGRYIKMTIQDQGIGIPGNYLAKIFDPFFTTKKKGSGLGLTTAYSIVRNHDGHITVESKVGEGTTFHIYLPASEHVLLPEVKSDDTTATGEGRVLVMDDEEIVRRIAGKMLSRMGYDVEYAKDGQEAVAVYSEALEEGRGFKVVILDLTVPGGMGGRDAVVRLLKIDPDVTAIVSSGYSTDPVMADFRWYGFKGVVAKPYEYEELAKVVDQAIRGSES